MANMFKAHIFARRQRGDREEVRLKLFNLDGTPVDIGADGSGTAGPQGPKGDPGAVGPQGPKGDPGAAVNPWVSVEQLPQQGPLATGQQNFGPRLDFTVGANGLVFVHASIQVWHPPAQMQVDLKLDAGTPSQVYLDQLAINQSSATMISLTTAGLVPSPKNSLANPNVMMVLAQGAHTLQFSSDNSNGNGFYQRVVLAAMAVG